MVESVNGVGAVGGNTPQPKTSKVEEGNVAINFNNGDKGSVNITIKEGMTLSELAVKYNTTVEDIKAANGITNSEIQVGQSLKIPQNTASEKLLATRKHSARMKAEEQEVQQKGLNTPEEKAKYFFEKDVASGRLKWVPQDSMLFGLISTGGYYEYLTEDEGLFGVETYGEIKDRYNLKDGVIKEHNYIPGGGNLDTAGIYDRKLKLYPEDMPIPK